MVIEDYTFKPHEIVWNNLYEQGVTSQSVWEKIISFDADYVINHQFYKVLGREDLAKMMQQISESDDSVCLLSLFPRTLDSNNTHVTAKDEDSTHGDGTGIYKVKQWKKIVAEMKKIDAPNDEYRAVIARQNLGMKTIFAPYVREMYIPGHEMISETFNQYFIRNF